MEQHLVPQHIASFEFKLFGNLTVRQFVTLLIPMSLAAIIYFSSLPFAFRISLSVIIGLFGLFIALVPINGRPFDKWAVAFIKAILSPTQRVWIKEPKIPEFLSVVTRPIIEEKIPEVVTVQSRERLRAYLRSLPKGGPQTPLDLREQIALERLGVDTQGAAEGALPPAISWIPSQASRPQVFATPISPNPPQDQYFGKMNQSLPPIDTTYREVAAVPKVALHAQAFALPGLGKKLKEQAQQKSWAPVELIKTPLAHLASENNYSIENIIPIQIPNRKIEFFPAIGGIRVRKLHFGPPEGFDLSKLPIRGERRFEISEALKQRFVFEETMPEALQAQPVPVKIKIQPQVAKTDQEKIPTPKAAKIPRPIPKSQTGPIHAQNVSFKKPQIAKNQSKISVSGQKSQVVPLPTSPNAAKIIPLTNEPNVLSGQISDQNENPLERAIVIVRDQNGIPIRALKTSKLGQFLSVTPLANGTYTIEVESELANFKPQAIKLEGKVLIPLEIKAQR